MGRNWKTDRETLEWISLLTVAQNLIYLATVPFINNFQRVKSYFYNEKAILSHRVKLRGIFLDKKWKTKIEVY